MGSKCRSPFDSDSVKLVEEYFIFFFVDGTGKNIKGRDNLKKELKRIKFSGDTAFMTIREYDERL